MNTETEITVSVPLTLAEILDLKIELEAAIERNQKWGCTFSAGIESGTLAKLENAEQQWYDNL